MAHFDITKAAHDGYKLSWEERSYLVKLAAAPFMIKLVCFMAVLMLGWEQNFVRQALVMLPSYFADGWLLSHLVRLVFFEQRWPFRPTGNTDRDMGVLQDRALGIMRGTLCFVVIKFLFAGLVATLMEANSRITPTEQEPLNLLMFTLGLASFVFFFWAFRFLWLYIPAAINYPIRRFMIDLGGYSASWHLIALWLLCFLPSFLVFGILLSNIIGDPQQSLQSFEMVFVFNFMRVMLDTVVGILTTAGIAIAIKHYILPKRR